MKNYFRPTPLKHGICLLITLVIFTITHAQPQYSTPYGNNPAAGGFKKINGINLYYEIYGTGKPVLLLHGNGGSIRSAAPKIEYLKKYFKVIAIDNRAHGKSADNGKQELTYVQMAADINALLDSLQVDSAYLFGQSDGGILGLLLAIHYPDKVSRVATFGANINPGKEAVYDEIDDLVQDTAKTTSDPHTKALYSLMAYQPNISIEELKKIKCPVLLMIGDRDAIRPEHTLRIFNAIPNSNLFVMPGATHFGSYEKQELFFMVFMDFLNKPFKKTSTVELFTGKH